MAYTVRTQLTPGEVEMRKVYATTLADMISKNNKVVALSADLMSSDGTQGNHKKDPVHFVQAGIQEANMVGVAAGMSLTGIIPYAHSFACFASRRVYDQAFISVGFAQCNVRIIGSDPGITATYNGGTHMPFEDAGLMRLIPGMTVVEPTDAVMLEDILRQTETLQGSFYIRMARKETVNIYEPGSTFQLGKAAKLREGGDVTLIAAGFCVAEAMAAADLLAKQGVQATVLDMYTLKPIDREAIVAAAQATGAVVTAENHNILNGLGSAVAEVLAEECPTPMGRVGIGDQYGQVGTLDYLRDHYGIGAQNIADKALEVLKRKKG